jgi:DNA-binding HxlR family transcriptional regulator
VIVRDLLLRGPLGFNALADGLPGISRSVLAARLRKLQDLGIVSREPDEGGVAPGYRVTYAGQQLLPVLKGLHEWSERFVSEEPAMIERDPDVVIMWVARRLDPERLPERRTVIELDLAGSRAKTAWLVVERGTPPSVCIEDPFLGPERYVYVSSEVRAIDAVARGLRSFAHAVADGSVQMFGEPALVDAAASWFRAPEAALHGSRVATP